MRLVNTKAQALVNYLLGVILIAAPWIFDFNAGGAVYGTLIFFAVVTWTETAFSRLEYAVIKIIPLKVHLYLDMLLGLFLAASPWLFGFSEEAFKPHLVFGLTQLVIAVITDRLLYEKVKVIKVKNEMEEQLFTEHHERKNRQ